MSRDDDRDLSNLYRSGATEEPPPALDRRVEKAARGIDRPSIWDRLTGVGSGWRLGFSAFALVVLSVSLVTLVHEEAPQPTEAGAPPAAAPATPDAPVIPESSQTATNSNHPVPLREASKLTPPATRSFADREASAEQSSEARRRAGAAEAPSEKRDMADLAIGPQAPSATRAQQKSEETREERVASPSPPPAAPPAAQSPSPDRSAAAMKSAPRVFVGPGQSATDAADEASTELPENWLARIERLLGDGRERDAVSEMNRFRRRYPNHPVPPALKRIVDLSGQQSREDPGSERRP